MNRQTLCIFGEVLFDIFPDGNRVLGGAPFNLAWHLQAFGERPRLISRVGGDAAGREIRKAMTDWGMNTEGVQQDADHPTGRVEVRVKNGEPAYHIVPDCAYDFISAEDLGDAAGGLLYHGSLALRHPVSARALARLKTQGPGRVFMDVNLRPPWWRRETVLSLIAEADWVKVNEAELKQLDAPSGPLLESAESFRERYGLRGLVVTRGHGGALAVTADAAPVQVKPANSVRPVVDTVGAGDAFAAVLVLGLLQAWPLALTMERAQAFASMLVSRQGAIVREKAFYRPFMDDWRLLR